MLGKVNTFHDYDNFYCYHTIWSLQHKLQRSDLWGVFKILHQLPSAKMLHRWVGDSLCWSRRPIRRFVTVDDDWWHSVKCIITSSFPIMHIPQ